MLRQRSFVRQLKKNPGENGSLGVCFRSFYAVSHDNLTSIWAVSREEETKIYKAKADHRNDAAKKLRDWLNNNRHIYKHKTVLHSTPRLHSRPVSFDWAEIKRSDQEDGAFAKIFKGVSLQRTLISYRRTESFFLDVKRLRLQGTLFYMADNVRSGQHLKCCFLSPYLIRSLLLIILSSRGVRRFVRAYHRCP